MSPAALPPGFRFHPTDDELVGYYLRRKVEGLEIELEVIPVIDLYKFDPWELPDKSFLPKRDRSWFFFCLRDRKYPNGSRANRATASGYWKATGKDRKISSDPSLNALRKALVFYRGRAPGGQRTDWLMHEYRLCEDNAAGYFNFVGDFALVRVTKRSELAHDKGGDQCGNGLKKLTVNVASKDLPPGTSLETGNGDELSPDVLDTDEISFWGSNVLNSNYTTVLPVDEELTGTSSVANDNYNSRSECLPCNLSPMSYTVLIKESPFFDGLSSHGCYSSGVFRNDENLMIQSFGSDSARYQNSINGSEAWNLVPPPVLCRQESEEEDADLWLREDNLLLVI